MNNLSGWKTTGFLSFPPSGMLRTHTGRLLFRALRPTIAEVQGSIPGQAWNFFKVLFQALGLFF